MNKKKIKQEGEKKSKEAGPIPAVPLKNLGLALHPHCKTEKNRAAPSPGSSTNMYHDGPSWTAGTSKDL